MPYWDDLTTSPKADGYGVFTKVSGTAPTRQFIVEWKAAFVSGGGPTLGNTFWRLSSTISVIPWRRGPVTSRLLAQQSGTGAATRKFAQQWSRRYRGAGWDFRVSERRGGGGYPAQWSPQISNQIYHRIAGRTDWF